LDAKFKDRDFFVQHGNLSMKSIMFVHYAPMND